MPVIRVTPVVRWLLIVSIGAFLFQLICDTFFGTRVFQVFAFTPAHVFDYLAVWQFVTYLFMHADLFHILFNMLVLWMIGSELEAKWGTWFFVKYYFTCGVAGAVFFLLSQVFLRGTAAWHMPLVGSSSAVYGLLVAYGIIYSERVLLFMMLFPMKAKHFVFVLAGIEFIATVFYSRSGVANIAHLGGMIVGFCYLFLSAYFRVRARQTKFRKKPSRKKHLRLVVNNEVLNEFEEDEEEENGPSKPTFH